jgi:ABC-type Mn2+/Zn2+ transport system permease subunit
VAVFSSLILYRGWSAVQDGSAQVTPGKAVGFCFIPFFNLYWNFVAHVGLMKEFNRLADSRGRPDQKVNEGLALTYSILTATICLSVLAGPFAVVFIWQTIGAVKDLENS